MGILDADWLALCRRVVTAQREVFDQVPGMTERTVYEGVGEGGDRTLAIDRRCEDIVFTELDQLGEEGGSFVAISEERGEVSYGSGGPARVVIDPIDGSLNARRTVPSHSLSIAVASGVTMADVEFGYVYDFGADEEFAARCSDGARANDAPMRVAEDQSKLEILGLEAAKPEWMLPPLQELGDRVYRLRVVGSIAIAASYVGAGRFDGMLSLRPCRSVDAAAAQLIAREAGGVVSFGERPLEEADLSLNARYPFAAAAGEQAMATISATQSQ
jgi:myo-inositol-1(or 4)-monophosphatase